MQDFNKILESKMNDTINGSYYGLDEIFCSLSHKESDQIVKIMRFCDKNVVHFYYLPRLFGEHLCAATKALRKVETELNPDFSATSNTV